ncbi:hypothetical protein [Cellvibrio sp. QJXJ]|uniref:hypothetical protein n=1 Tax=Cellvibrio sp. QJXJ TaxID=2964606 RepID=UPI0021C3853F|nr:hypothetical protein [Cellvibrio sp. QJXJ]UUA75128.1 hypothetical protein NNX04_21980 [Cellvibrio sp. QJXJ]
MKIKLLVALTAVCAQSAFSCTICQDVGEYGTSVTQSIASAGNSITSTTNQIAQNYTSTSSALMQTGDSIVSAITASSNSVTIELAKNAEIQSRLMEGFKGSLEQLEKSKLIAETNQKVAETYGPENIPAELCEDYSRTGARQDAKEIVETLIQLNSQRQIEERMEENRTQIVDPYTANAINLSSASFTEEEAKIAMEQASVVSGERSFPVSPDVLLNQSTTGGGGSKSAEQMMSAWIRASNASQELSNQIAKRTIPKSENAAQDGTEAISIIGDMWKAVEQSSGQDANIQDSSNTGAGLQRSISRRVGLSNRIKLEQLETQMAIARINASQLGFINERALSQLQSAQAQTDASSKIKRSTNEN